MHDMGSDLERVGLRGDYGLLEERSAGLAHALERFVLGLLLAAEDGLPAFRFL